MNTFSQDENEGLAEDVAALQHEYEVATGTAELLGRTLAEAHSKILELEEQLEAAQKALRELHEEMWTVSNDDGPEFVSPAGLRYLRSWFKRTSHLLGEVSSPATPPLVDVDDLRAAFQEVLGYLTAYRVHGAEAGPDLGWAIRNFNEILDSLREESTPASEQESA